MTRVDWGLLIGYDLAEAEEYLYEEEVPYRIVATCAPRKKSEQNHEELRVIGVRMSGSVVELIVSTVLWSL